MFQIRAWERYKFLIDYEHRQVFLLDVNFSICCECWSGRPFVAWGNWNTLMCCWGNFEPLFSNRSSSLNKGSIRSAIKYASYQQADLLKWCRETVRWAYVQVLINGLERSDHSSTKRALSLLCIKLMGLLWPNWMQHKSILERQLPESLKLAIARKIENNLFSRASNQNYFALLWLFSFLIKTQENIIILFL